MITIAIEDEITNINVILSPTGWYKRKFKHEYQGIKDFKGNENAAHDWIKRKSEKWLKNLKIHEKEALTSYTNFALNINTYLREFKEPVEEKGNLTEEEWNDYQKHNNQIKNIDSALQKSKTSKAMYVYRRVEEIQFYSVAELKNESLKLRTGTKINNESFKKLLDRFILNQTEYQDPAYVSTSVSQDPTGVKFAAMRPILLKIKVPIGASIGFFGKKIAKNFDMQNEGLIARNSKFKYRNAVKTIDKNGFEIISINVDLLI